MTIQLLNSIIKLDYCYEISNINILYTSIRKLDQIINEDDIIDMNLVTELNDNDTFNATIELAYINDITKIINIPFKISMYKLHRPGRRC